MQTNTSPQLVLKGCPVPSRALQSFDHWTFEFSNLLIANSGSPFEQQAAKMQSWCGNGLRDRLVQLTDET